MWHILQNDKPDEFVIATGVQHSVREFCYYAFKYAGIELEIQGEGLDEKGIDKTTGNVLVEVSPDFYRPTDVVNLWGDPAKARAKLVWNPYKASFEELVKIIVDHYKANVADKKTSEQVICMNIAENWRRELIYAKTPEREHVSKIINRFELFLSYLKIGYEFNNIRTSLFLL